MKRVFKQVLMDAINSPPAVNLLQLLENRILPRANCLAVLTYHRVEPLEAQQYINPDLISATPELFERQMSYLAENYHVVAMAEVLEAAQKGTELPPRSVLITFDDAYCDFATNAWPILRRYRLPVTLFVPTGFPDRPARSFWWDRLYQALYFGNHVDYLDTPLGRLPLTTRAEHQRAIDELFGYIRRVPHQQGMALVEQVCQARGVAGGEQSVLSWQALRQLAGSGVTLGAHTRTHPFVNQLSLEEARLEAVGSLRDLEREVGAALPVFAYPGGELSEDIVRMLRCAGFALAFTTVPGINDLRKADRLRMRRVHIGLGTSVAVLRAKLLFWSSYMY